MKVRLETFWLPKNGACDSEYEDAFLPATESERDLSFRLGQPMNIAIADGATEASFSRDWAKDLTSAYVRDPCAFYRKNARKQLPTLIGELGARLNSRIGELLRASDVPWYAEEKAQQGAFAALLGLTVWEIGNDRSERGKWRAAAIGDCCLFHIRNRELLVSFPLENSAQFNNHPCLLSSRSDVNGALSEHHLEKSGTWQDGDEFLLMTDAMACWFLQRWELRSDPLELLDHVRDQHCFAKLIKQERGERLPDGTPLLRNDDVTLTRCLLRGSSDVLAG